MEEHNSLEYWLKKVRERWQEKEVEELAEILVEAMLWKLEGRVEEPRVERSKKKPKTDLLHEFYF